MKMRKLPWLATAVATTLIALASTKAADSPSGHYLFAWSGAVGGKGENFIAVVDADPKSPRHGQLVTSAAARDRRGQPGFDTGVQKRPHGWSGAAQVHGVVFSKE